MGAALGIGDHADKVSKSAEDMATGALKTLHAQFKNARDKVGLPDTLHPTITPILDLTQLQKDATKIGSSFGHHTISANVSRRQARDIASEQAARHNHKPDDGVKGDVYNFNQEIKSADPINHVKVYRGTNSQIALFKEVTGK
jgi:hypothetical protein